MTRKGKPRASRTAKARPRPAPGSSLAARTPTGNPPGRPSRIEEFVQTPDGPRRLVDLIFDRLKIGASLQGAAASVGVHRHTLEEWQRRGAEERAAGRPGSFADFLDGTERARGEFEMTMLKQWAAATPADWQAARALLRARLPEHYREDARLELTGPGGVPLMTDEAQRRVLRDAAARLKTEED